MLRIALCGLGYGLLALAQNSTLMNPFLPGFYPDPSCIFVPEFDDTFFCASSSFLAFPGLPITASRDLQSWTLISHAFNRPEQLPVFAGLQSPSGGIWAPTLRYRDGLFYLVSTCVVDDLPANDSSRWNNFIITTDNPYCSKCWSDPAYFTADGYDPDIFWDDDGQAYVTWSLLWNVRPGIMQSTINVDTGEVGTALNVWNGTGGLAPEGPHIYKKGGHYYLLIAEGGTGLNHMVTIARSRKITGPFESNPVNPILSNANTTEYLQAVGHADLFYDNAGNWWGTALSMRLNLQARAAPMGRESVLYPVTWKDGEWPVLGHVQGYISSWPFPHSPAGEALPGIPVATSENIDFTKADKVPANLIYYGLPNARSHKLLGEGLCLTPSSTGKTSLEKVTRISRRQSHTLFTYRVDVNWSPKKQGDESGVSVFVDPDNHFDLGIVQLPARKRGAGSSRYLQFQAKGNKTISQTTLTDFPADWGNGPITLEIKAFNATHYAFSAGPAEHDSQLQTIAVAPSGLLQPYFTGAVVGVYTKAITSRSRAEACFTHWTYRGEAQYRD
ncbi:glycosyl hydrolase [Aspergillus carlsbadensis]|nr:glycosyl hydrolase [Aspergillus carlsbadensis]